jgi:polysaccharide export outer membrane protein
LRPAARSGRFPADVRAFGRGPLCHHPLPVGTGGGTPLAAAREISASICPDRYNQSFERSDLKPILGTWLARLGLAPFLAGLALLAGCSTAPSHPPAPATLPASTDYTYVVGPGDSLNIIVWRNPELTMSVPVRPDGKVSAPLVEELSVEGKTTAQIAREVEKVLGKYVRDPIVTVLVTGFQGPYSEQIRVVGEAARPQFLPYKVKMTLLDVMISVGGLTDFAAGNKATIQRTAEGNKLYSVRIQDLLKRGDLSANVEMRPGDILIIPQSLF